MTTAALSRSLAARPDGEDEVVRVRRRQNRAKLTRSQIIEAATSAFAQHGFNGTTTRDIAHQARVRHASVLYHFESKLGVWQAVMRHVLDGFSQPFSARLEALHDVDDIMKLRLLQADFIRTSATRPELHWLMSHEAGGGGERVNWLLENFLGREVATFTNLIRSAQAAGRYAPGDPLHLHYAFVGAATRIFTMSTEMEVVMGQKPFHPAFVDRHIELCAELFFRPPPPLPQHGLPKAPDTTDG